MQPRCQNCRLKHRMLRSIETEGISHSALMNHVGRDDGPFGGVVDLHDFEFVPAATILENLSPNNFSGECGWDDFQEIKCRLGQQKNIVDHVKDTLWSKFEILIRCRGLKWSQDQFRHRF